jgi:hypothetical protein
VRLYHNNLNQILISHFYSLGTYQLKRGRSYAEELTSTTNLNAATAYPVQRCRQFNGLIRVSNRSAHTQRTKYNSIIKFNTNEIIDWWCDCKAGSRFVGCCSHVASVIWFLSHARWQTQNRQMFSSEFIGLFKDADDYTDSSDETEETDSDDCE